MIKLQNFMTTFLLQEQLTQLVEYFAYNEKVSGSNPLLFNKYITRRLYGKLVNGTKHLKKN